MCGIDLRAVFPGDRLNYQITVRLTPVILLLFLGACATAPEPVTPSKPIPPAPVVVPKPVPPAAAARPVSDNYHGTDVIDPYRYFEDLKNPEVATLLKAQSEYAHAQLDRIPGRAGLLDRISQLSEAGVSITGVQIAGAKVFYFKLAPGDSVRKLYVRDRMDGAERLLIDPLKVGTAEHNVTIDYFQPSPSGRHVAYGVSAGGDENSVLRVFDVEKGNDLGIVIEGARYGAAVSWYPDGKSFFYNKLPTPEAGSTVVGYTNSLVYRHTLGNDPTHDVALFGRGIGSLNDLAEIDIPSVVVPVGAKHALAVVRHGDARELEIYIASADALHGASTRWMKVIDRSDEVTDFEVRGMELYLLTHKNAPRYKVVRTNLMRPQIAKATAIIPEGEDVVSQIAIAADALYIKQSKSGVDVLQRLNFSTSVFSSGKLEYLRLPFDLAVRALVTDPARPGALLRLESWTDAPLYVALEERTGNIKDTELLPRHGADFSAVDEVRLFATAKDGTRIPVSMVYQKGILLSRDHPTLLTGYGAYGIALSPSFEATRLAWIERGGIYATCHVRGGGEYGEAWHRGGQKANKNNTINDFIACAEFLIARGFTNPKRLAALGGSAGAITVGNALVRRPDLFAAVVPRVGVLDMLRMKTTPNGSPSVAEFGSTATPEGFKWLYETSAYHHVGEQTAYPGVLVTTGANDPRVEPWNSLKFAVRLQAATTSPTDIRPVLLRVDYDTGHRAGVNRSSANEELADIYAFMLWQFGMPGFQPSAPQPQPLPSPDAGAATAAPR
jgi:prolyl oligopeptidase